MTKVNVHYYCVSEHDNKVYNYNNNMVVRILKFDWSVKGPTVHLWTLQRSHNISS